MKIDTLLIPRTIFGASPSLHILIICFLFVFTTLTFFREYRNTGKMAVFYPLRISILFVPIYEEVIFRCFILVGLMNLYSPLFSVVLSSLLFGLWHLKNIFYIPRKNLIYQIVYTGFIVAPIASLLVLTTGTIWIAVILHYIHNILVHRTQSFLNKFRSKKSLSERK